MAKVDYSKAKLYGFLAIILTLTFFALITAVVWLPILLLLSPVLIVSFLILKYTRLGKPVLAVYYYVYDWLFYKSEKPRKFLWQFAYDVMCLLYPQTVWTAMNYGFATLNGDGKVIKNLKPKDEDERFCLQLYHWVATKLGKQTDLNNLRVLEVGSGRGGGLNYISNYLNPQQCYGVDFSENQVKFCQETYKSNENLFFYEGDAEHLVDIPQLQQQSFDIVINIESSHCYGNFENFVQQVAAMVKPGGYFLFTDFRSSQLVDLLKQQLTQGKYFEIEKEQDITINVQQSLQLDEKRKLELITENVYSFLQPFFKKFSGVQGTRINTEFVEKKTRYMAYVLKRI